MLNIRKNLSLVLLNNARRKLRVYNRLSMITKYAKDFSKDTELKICLNDKVVILAPSNVSDKETRQATRTLHNCINVFGVRICF